MATPMELEELDEARANKLLADLDYMFDNHDRKTCKVDCCMFCFMDEKKEHDANPCGKEICVLCEMKEKDENKSSGKC